MVLEGTPMPENMRTATLQPQFRHTASTNRLTEPRKSLILLECERGDLNPYALRHWILSPARLPFRHSRTDSAGLCRLYDAAGDGVIIGKSARKPAASPTARASLSRRG